MSISLHAATVPSYLQILGAASGLIDKARAFCDVRDIPHQEIIGARLAEDMLPFGYQVKSMAVHSIGAIEGVRKGSFSPDIRTPPDSFDGLRERLTETSRALEAIDPEEMEGFIGRPMRFTIGDGHIDFTAENFLLSFSQPNFYFHATTAYDVLRHCSMAIGKRDYLGRWRKMP